MHKRARIRLAILFVILLLIASAQAANASAIRTYLTFRVTTRAQSAVVNVGEDLQIEVGVDGVEPTAWQWYFNGQQLTQDADQRVYNIVNAQLEDAGLYRMQAYNGTQMVLSVDVNVRVIDPTVLPPSGDDSLPVTAAFAVMALGLCALPVLYKARRRA